MKNHRTIHIITMWILSFLAFSQVQARTQNDFFLMDTVAATVNDEVITISEVVRELEWKKRLARQLKKGKTPTLGVVLNQFIDRTVLLQQKQATQFFSLKKSDVDRKYQQLIDLFHGEESLINAFSTVGYSRDEFFRLLWVELTVEKYLEQKLIPKIRVSEDEITQFLKEHPELQSKGAAANKESLRTKERHRSVVNLARENITARKFKELRRDFLHTLRKEAVIKLFIHPLM